MDIYSSFSKADFWTRTFDLRSELSVSAHLTLPCWFILETNSSYFSHVYGVTPRPLIKTPWVTAKFSVVPIYFEKKIEGCGFYQRI